MTDAEKADFIKLTADKSSSVAVAKTQAITEQKCVDQALGFSRPTEIIHESAKEGIRVIETIAYVHPPDHKGWGAEAGRTYRIEKIEAPK